MEKKMTKKEKIVRFVQKRFPPIGSESSNEYELSIMDTTVEETIKEIRGDIIKWAIGCFDSHYDIHATERLEKMLEKYMEIPKTQKEEK